MKKDCRDIYVPKHIFKLESIFMTTFKNDMVPAKQCNEYTNNVIFLETAVTETIMNIL